MIELVRASLADVAFARELFELTSDAASFATELVLDDAELIVVDRTAPPFGDAAGRGQAPPVGGERIGWVQSSLHGNAIHLAQLHIAPAWRGRGIGRMVVDRVIERAHVARRDVTLAVQAASRARRLYERLGFRLDPASMPAGDTIYLRRQLTSE